jgi:uncharacterized protein
MANPNGTPIWFELNTPDQAATTRFYESVIGWAIVPAPIADSGGYLIANGKDGTGVAGIMTPPPEAPAFPGWSIYFATGDVDAAAEQVKSLGGAIQFGPMDIPEVGRFAVATDPQGVVFFLMKGASPEDSQAFKQMAGDAGLGHGVWIELATPDPDAALDFYGKLFGWSKQGAMPMGPMGDYTFIGRSESDRPGAIMASATTNAPARWNMYFQVADIDAAIAKAKDGGGTVTGPDEIPGGDYSANVTDPHGQQVGIVGPRK